MNISARNRVRVYYDLAIVIILSYEDYILLKIQKW